MNEVKDDSPTPDHILALMGSVLDGLRQDLLGRMRGEALPPELRGLRASQMRLLSLTPATGLRVSDLAERVGMTKQALGEFATALEGLGLVESVRDPADKRVRIIRPTELGLRMNAVSAEVIGAMEADWRERVGARTWDRLRAALILAADRGPARDVDG